MASTSQDPELQTEKPNRSRVQRKLKKTIVVPPKPEPVPYIPQRPDDPELEESQTVHEVYEAIAPHFSQTRSKPWRLISEFLESLPSGTIGLDSGAGNGKYLPTACGASSSSRSSNPAARETSNGRVCIALDRSEGLLEIAKTQLVQGGECMRGDLCFGGWRVGVFDWAISVAAIHHLTTPQRRRESVQALIRPLVFSTRPPYSRFMIYVWAYEQGEGSKRKMGIMGDHHLSPPSEDQGVIGGKEKEKEKEKIQDVLVPWVYNPFPRPPLPTRSTSTCKPIPQSNTTTAPDTDTNTDQSSNNPSQPPQSNTRKLPKEIPEPKVYHRYYHLFVAGELRKLVESAGMAEGMKLRADGEDMGGSGGGDEGGFAEGERWLRIRGEGWEADNWWIEGEVGMGSEAVHEK